MSDDPWVMYLVVRKDHPLTRGAAMALAGTAAVRCTDAFAANPRWSRAFAAWAPRPRKVALRAGAQDAMLIDDVGQLDWSRLQGARCVGVTAGASAPEVLVREVIEALADRFAVSEEQAEHQPEQLTFKLPRELVA